MTAAELLARQRPFLRAVGRHAAVAVCARLGRHGGDLAAAANAALDERASQRRSLATTTDPATRERCARAIARLEMEAIVAFDALAGTATGSSAGQRRTSLAARMVQDDSWRLVDAAFDGLAADLVTGHPAPGLVLARARALASDDRAPVWSQIAALRFLASSLGPLAVPTLQHRLRPRDGRDDLFVRAEAASLLATVDTTAAMAALSTCADDPSEHVRMRLCRLWGLLGLRAKLRERLDPAIEPSPRVRAVAATQLGPRDAVALAGVMASDPDEIPRRVALEEAEGLLADTPALLPAIRQMAHADPAGTLRRLAADALERIHHRTDAQAAQALGQLEKAAVATPPGGTRMVNSALPDLTLGRALAVASARDHGLALQRRRDGRWKLFRGDSNGDGDPLGLRLCRLLQRRDDQGPSRLAGFFAGAPHRARGQLRAGSGLLGEPLRPSVAGDRVLVPALGDWGRHLPTVDDLLTRPADGQALVFSSFGVTRIRFPSRAAWPLARLRLHRDHAHLRALRLRALMGVQPHQRRAFVDELGTRGFRLDLEPHRPTGNPIEVLDLFARTAPPLVTKSGQHAPWPALGFLPALGDLLPGPDGPGAALPLLALGAVAAGLWLSRWRQSQQRLQTARDHIPLVVGGWGSRGRAGTERLKAALFQGLGCRVLAQPSGWQPALLHAIPGVRAHEIFLPDRGDPADRPHQRQLVQLGAALGVDVLLAQRRPPRPCLLAPGVTAGAGDDLATVTNALPPPVTDGRRSAIDVARAISQALPRRRPAFTAEDQMLPVLRDGAGARGTPLGVPCWRDEALLPDDLRQRFPRTEHPRNIALVVKLGEALGVPAAVALKEMADWVVPDLGAPRTYPVASWRGRKLQLSNATSARDRVTFQRLWSRLGVPGDRDVPGTWIVTLLNLPGQRASGRRIAEILVRDAPAHRHVLITDNVAKLTGIIEQVLATFTDELALFDEKESALPTAERIDRADARARRMLARLGVHSVGAEGLYREARQIAHGRSIPDAPVTCAPFADALDAAQTTAVDVPRAVRQRLAARLPDYVHALGSAGDEALDHLAALAVTHATVARWFAALAASADSTASADATHRSARWSHLEQQFRRLYAQIFRAALVIIPQPSLTGDQLIDRVARAVPPGFRARIVAAANLAGPVLELVSRWRSYERTISLGRRLTEAAAPADAEALATTLTTPNDAADMGMLDLSHAYRAVECAASRWPESSTLARARTTLADRLADAVLALGSPPPVTLPRWRRLAAPLLNLKARIHRRRQTEGWLAALARGDIAQAQAARGLHDLLSGSAMMRRRCRPS